MSYKFMKITRVVIPFMTLVVLTSQLTGCASLNPSELIDETDKSQEVELLIPSLDPDKIGNSSVTVDGNEYTYDTSSQQSADQLKDDSEIGRIDNDRHIVSGDRLIEIFEKAYQSGKELKEAGTSMSDEELISYELLNLTSETTWDEQLPDDYAEQYKAWRAEKVASEAPAKETPSPSKKGSSNGNTPSGSSGSPSTSTTPSGKPPVQKGAIYDEGDGTGGVQDVSDDIGTEELNPGIDWSQYKFKLDG